MTPEKSGASSLTWSVLNAAVLAALTILALAPLYAAFGSGEFWIAAGVGTALGTAIAIAGKQWRWGILTIAAISVVGYFAFGAVAAYRDTALGSFIPTFEILASLAAGVVHVWKQMLTLPDPLGGFPQLLVAPYLIGLVTSVTAISLGLRLRRFAFALVPLCVVFTGSVAFSSYRSFHPAAIGAFFAAGVVGWLVWRTRIARADESLAEPHADRSPRRVATSLGVVAVLVVAVLVGGGSALAAPGTSREVLRDKIVPPLDVHDYATPLTSFRKLIADGEDTELFTIDGLPPGARVRLAALDLYDGVVYKVSGSGGAGAGVFARVGRQIPSSVDGEPVSATVTVEDLTGVWLPTVGSVTELGFTGADAAARAEELHYNSASGTAVATAGLASGDTYSLRAVIPDIPADDDLADVAIADVSTPVPAAIPDQITAVLDSLGESESSAIAQLRALQAYFTDTGFYSDGLEGQVASRSGHGLARETELLAGDQMIGGAEQYAVAMALAVAQLGIPVRVVMGFETAASGPTTVVTGDDVTAWVEVPFEDVGWVSFDPTPAKDRVPQELTQQQSQKPRVQVAQPPDSPQEPAELPPAPPVEEASQGDPPLDLSWLWAIARWAGIALLILALVLGPSLVLAVLRARRRRAREAAAASVDRMAGGWAELVDSALDVGAPLPPSGTRREVGRTLDSLYPDAGAAVLASRADTAVFGPGDPTDPEAAAYWQDIASATKRLEEAVTWRRRLRAKLLPASMLRRRGRKPGGSE